MKSVIISSLCALALVSIGCTNMNKKADEAAKAEKKTETQEQAKSLSKEGLKGEVVFGCKVGKDIRLVSVDKTEKRCEVYYQKFGDSQQVAWAEATPSICTNVKSQIKTNIESKGFKCDEDIAKNYLKDLKGLQAKKAPETATETAQ